jgi:hypothetical protein
MLWRFDGFALRLPLPICFSLDAIDSLIFTEDAPLSTTDSAAELSSGAGTIAALPPNPNAPVTLRGRTFTFTGVDVGVGFATSAATTTSAAGAASLFVPFFFLRLLFSGFGQRVRQ